MSALRPVGTPGGPGSAGGGLADVQGGLDRGRDGHRPVVSGDALEVVVRVEVGVYVGRGVVYEFVVFEERQPVCGALGAVAHVHGDRQAEVAGRPPFGECVLLARDLGAQRRQRHCHPAGEQLPVDAPGLGVEVAVAAVAVAEHRPDAGRAQCGDARVRVGGAELDVRPVDQRRDAGVQAFERAGERPGVDVVRAVAGRQLAEDAGQVGGERAVGEDRAERRLPGVAVRVDEARHDDAAGGVDRLGAGGGGQFSADRGDAAVLDEHVGGAEDGGGGCGVDDEAVRDEE